MSDQAKTQNPQAEEAKPRAADNGQGAGAADAQKPTQTASIIIINQSGSHLKVKAKSKDKPEDIVVNGLLEQIKDAPPTWRVQVTDILGAERPQTRLQNQTTRHIELRARDGKEELKARDGREVVRLAPLEERLFEAGKLDKFDLDEWEQLNVVKRKVEDENPKLLENLVSSVGVALFVYVIVGAMVSGYSEKVPPYFHLGSFAVTPLSLYCIVGFIIITFGAVGYYLYVKRWGGVARRFGSQLLSLFIIILIAVGLPTFGVYRFGGGADLIASTPSPAQLGRWLQLLFIAVASLLPALLYEKGSQCPTACGGDG